jgi:CrcB protein
VLPYVAAALGGALGALARWGVSEGLPHSSGGWPWSTLLVNLTGCLLIGLLVATVFTRYPAHRWLRPFLGTGVLGGYTTFSTFAVDGVRLADAGAWLPAVGYVLVSVVGGVLAAAVGVRLGRALLTRPRPVEATAEEVVG